MESIYKDINTTQLTYNAKWISPSEVARNFIPTSDFSRLVSSESSIMLGPRGSGKTTLLKMLTRSALNTWRQERDVGRYGSSFDYPQFEAVYIPSDVRWSLELNGIGSDAELEEEFVHKIQRVLIISNILLELTSTYETIIEDQNTDVDERKQMVAKRLIDLWQLNNTVPIFYDIKSTVQRIPVKIRGAINRGSLDTLEEIFDSLGYIFFSHVTDPAILSYSEISDILDIEKRDRQWALCFDELEIAPSWLRKEVLESLRSIDQNFLLKLTWHPLLPSGVRNLPEELNDFSVIRLWNSHVLDARDFCERLTRQFLDKKFPDYDLDPQEFFSYSLFAQSGNEENQDIYEKGGTFYQKIIELAERDESFRKLLEDEEVDPDDPTPENSYQKNTLFRKLKPIVLLRSEFRDDEGVRSRKVVILYAGRESIYSVSEGNPRWLLVLLESLYSRWQASQDREASHPKISYATQARVINSFARKYKAKLSSIPSKNNGAGNVDDLTLVDFITRVGNEMKKEVLGDKFPLDPVGSFYIKDGSSIGENVRGIIKRALEVGALTYIGKSDESVPRKIEGSRFRLTFRLAPIFRLPFRNYRSVSLSYLFKDDAGTKQYDLFASND